MPREKKYAKEKNTNDLITILYLQDKEEANTEACWINLAIKYSKLTGITHIWGLN